MARTSHFQDLGRRILAEMRENGLQYRDPEPLVATIGADWDYVGEALSCAGGGAGVGSFLPRTHFS